MMSNVSVEKMLLILQASFSSFFVFKGPTVCVCVCAAAMEARCWKDIKDFLNSVSVSGGGGRRGCVAMVDSLSLFGWVDGALLNCICEFRLRFNAFMAYYCPSQLLQHCLLRMSFQR